MWEWLERVREKPESVRRTYVYISAGAVTLLIVLVWLLFIYATGEAGKGPVSGDLTDESESTLEESLGGMYGDFKRGASQIVETSKTLKFW